MHRLSPFLLLSLLLTAFISGDAFVQWTPERKLRWADFTGAAPARPPYSAYTYVMNAYDVNTTSDSVFVNVTCRFQNNLSWRLNRDTSDYLLNHEQGHFDLCEVHARKFRMYVSKWNGKQDLATYLSSNFNVVYIGLQQMHKTYDKETDHSRNKAQQKKWDEKIESMLRSYADFADTTVRMAR
jgi:hypothetical protein